MRHSTVSQSISLVRAVASRALALVAALALLGAGCQPAAQDASDMESQQGEEEMGQEEMGMAPALSSEQAIEMERGLWQALGEGDYDGFAQMIADDVALVGGDGLTSKQELMATLEGSTVESYELGDFRVMQPGADVAVVTYSYSETWRPADADSAESYSGWATSIWENRDGTWLTVFHQSSDAPATEEGAEE